MPLVLHFHFKCNIFIIKKNSFRKYVLCHSVQPHPLQECLGMFRMNVSWCFVFNKLNDDVFSLYLGRQIKSTVCPTLRKFLFCASAKISLSPTFFLICLKPHLSSISSFLSKSINCRVLHLFIWILGLLINKIMEISPLLMDRLLRSLKCTVLT